MEKDLTDKKSSSLGEAIIMTDECGDSLWDAVLEQDVKACGKNSSDHSDALLKEIDVLRKSRAFENESRTDIK